MKDYKRDMLFAEERLQKYIAKRNEIISLYGTSFVPKELENTILEVQNEAYAAKAAYEAQLLTNSNCATVRANSKIDRLVFARNNVEFYRSRKSDGSAWGIAFINTEKRVDCVLMMSETSGSATILSFNPAEKTILNEYVVDVDDARAYEDLWSVMCTAGFDYLQEAELKYIQTQILTELKNLGYTEQGLRLCKEF